jgi:hypothetical protein
LHAVIEERGGFPMSKRPDQSLIERVQAEVQEIAEVLSRRSGKSITEVWNEALTPLRVRYETEVLPRDDDTA